MALEVTSSTVSGLQKTAQAPEGAPEQRTAARTADAAAVSTSMQNERQAVARTENGTINANKAGTEAENILAEKTNQNIKRIQSAVNRANDKMKRSRTSCEFSYHEETNRVSIKIYDEETKEVIREIPSEEALELVQKMWEMAGMLVDERR